MKIVWGLFFIMFILTNLLVQSIIWTMPGEDKINETECYDRYGNEIKDLVCEEKIIGISTDFKLGLSIMVLIVSFLLSLAGSNLRGTI